jgi:hypothetical protein
MEQMLPVQVQLLLNAIQLIEQANADIQFALPAGDQCYRLHSKLSDVVEELETLT